eukprot:UN01385
MAEQVLSHTDESPYTPLDQSPSSSSTYDTANVIGSKQNISQTRSSISPISQQAFQHNSNYIAITQTQLLLLLTNDLQQRRDSNKIIGERLINDQKEFENIEKILNSKIRKYQKNIQQKLQDVDFDHMDDLLNEIIELDEKSSKIKKEIRKKKWYQDKNEIYRTITSNNSLLNSIDDMTQKIDYWQQMLLITTQGYHSPP